MNHCEQEIKEMISLIKKAVQENLWVDSWTIQHIQDHLLRLKNYVDHLHDSQDFLSVVSDFIATTKSLPDIPGNHLQNKLTLKSHIARLEEEFRRFQQKADLFQQLGFVNRWDYFERN